VRELHLCSVRTHCLCTTMTWPCTTSDDLTVHNQWWLDGVHSVYFICCARWWRVFLVTVLFTLTYRLNSVFATWSYLRALDELLCVCVYVLLTSPFYVQLCACVCESFCACAWASVYVCERVFVCVCVNACRCVNASMCVNACMCLCVHHLYVHTYQ
jgi:hypothetical protein